MKLYKKSKNKRICNRKEGEENAKIFEYNYFPKIKKKSYIFISIYTRNKLMEQKS